MDSTFDLPAFLLDKLYDNMDWDDGWTLADAVALAEDIRRYDGIDCDPQEIYPQPFQVLPLGQFADPGIPRHSKRGDN